MKTMRWGTSLVLSVALLATMGCKGLPFGNRGAQAKKEEPHTVGKGEVTTEVVETGTIEALKTVEVKSRVGGRVARLLVDEGDYVTAGELIAVIDPQETELQVRQTRAQLNGAISGVRRTDIQIQQQRTTLRNAVERARSNVRQIEAELKVQPDLTQNAIQNAEISVRTAKQSLEQLVSVTQPNAKVTAQNSVKDAENSLNKAKAEENRQKELLDQGYTARRNYESAVLERQLSESRLASARDNLNRLDEQQRLERTQAEERVRQAESELSRAKLNSVQDVTKREQYQQALRALSDAEAQLRGIDADIAGRAQQQSSVEQIRAQLSDGERQLGETEIRAPIDGVVTKRLVQQGELVSSLSSFSSGTPIVRIEDRSGLLVRLQINEVDVARLNAGTEAEIRVDALPGQKFAGKVRKVAPTSIAAGASATGQSAGNDPVVKYDVEVLFDSSNPDIKSGMSSSVTMTVSRLTSVVRVPFDYIGIEKDGSRFVMLAPAEGETDKEKLKGTKQKVQIGTEGNGFIQIVEGLKEGDKIVKPEFNGPRPPGAFEVSTDDE
ncbi:MAG: efflux RND transporter periplasmic adaptor subunit [Fimbriimonadaceae bacterium]|nr:efflux RND transporter periplasmic adaptor subunit [Fimbriimonadaceae bacterium]